MPIFHTAHGAISVTNWGYQLQGANGGSLNPAALAALNFDLLVTDFARDGTEATKFTKAEVDAIKAGTVAVSYMSIGEASDFRSFWNPAWTTNGSASGSLTGAAPSWLGPTNPDWPDERKVRYWEPGWQNIIFNDQKTGWLDQIVKQGFDAAYLDIVDAYYFWAAEVRAADRKAGDPTSERDAALRMIDFIVAMTAHARETNPFFFVIPQNGEFILDALTGADAAKKAAYLDAIGAIGVEDVYLPGTADENNPFRPDEERISVLKRDFLANGKPVFAVDYVTRADLKDAFVKAAIDDGFIPTVAPSRDLDATVAPIDVPGPGGTGGVTLMGGPGHDVLIGGLGADTLLGNGGHDVLNGGPGSDLMRGGPGNDTYIVDRNTDRVIELAGQGTDLVKSWVTFVLGANVETLALLGPGAINGTGNALNNVIAGTAAANRLSGLGGNDFLNGGPGADVLSGGPGNDTYVVDNAGDRVIEAANQGTDVVRSLITYQLGPAVEHLALLGALAVNGTGNTLGNVIRGNAAANVLRGLDGNDVLAGGAGNDTLVGGPGHDAFVFTTLPSATSNSDKIVDFNVAADTIRLENAVFTKLAGSAGQALSAPQFFTGSAAHDATDRLIYNPATGALLYDGDGNQPGGAAAVQIAMLAKGLSLTHADFFIV